MNGNDKGNLGRLCQRYNECIGICDEKCVVYHSLLQAYEQGKSDAVVHGQWEDEHCTACGSECLCNGIEESVESKYCPSCGAQMDAREGAGHARYIPSGRYATIDPMIQKECSRCGCGEVLHVCGGEVNHCPNCGAELDEDHLREATKMTEEAKGESK